VIAESGRFNPAAKPPIKRIAVTKGSRPPLRETAVATYKTKTINIDLKNINDVTLE